MEAILPLVIIIGLIVLGILFCFWGYKYLRVIMLIYVFIAGMSFMFDLLTEVAPEMGDTIWIISIAVGLILAALSFFFIKFCIFLVGGMVGILIFNMVRDLNPAFFGGLDSIWVFLIGLAFFIVLGLITLAASKHFIIIFSALFGAYTMVNTFGILLGLVIEPANLSKAVLPDVTASLQGYSIFAGAPLWAFYIPIAVFAIMGVIAQYRFTSRGVKY